MVASRKTGAVNLVVSRESGGAVRAPGNAGDKSVKRQRGSRIAAAVAARIDNCRSRVGQVSQCRRERRVRGLEAVRDGMGTQASGRGMWDS